MTDEKKSFLFPSRFPPNNTLTIVTQATETVCSAQCAVIFLNGFLPFHVSGFFRARPMKDRLSRDVQLLSSLKIRHNPTSSPINTLSKVEENLLGKIKKVGKFTLSLWTIYSWDFVFPSFSNDFWTWPQCKCVFERIGFNAQFVIESDFHFQTKFDHVYYAMCWLIVVLTHLICIFNFVYETRLIFEPWLSNYQ